MAVQTASDVMQAVVTKWQATPALSAISGPYSGVAPHGAAYPRCNLILADDGRHARTCATTYFATIVRFVVRDRTPELAAASLRLVIAAFDPATLTIPNGAQVSLQREGEQAYEEDQALFVASADYRVIRGFAR